MPEPQSVTPAPRLCDVLDSAPDLLLATDADGVVTYVSARCRELLGVDPHDVLSRPVAQIVHPDDRERIADLARRAREDAPGRRLSIEFTALLDTGGTRLVEADVTTSELTASSGEVVWAVRELGSRHTHDLGADTSHRDHLTGLPNRAMLLEVLTRATARAERAHTRLATVVVGVDQFAQTWEDVGHKAAEELLLSAAGRLESIARPGDLVARTGVDEFAVLLDGFHDVDEVLSLTRDALRSLSHPVSAGSRSLSMGASAGIAVDREGTEGTEGTDTSESLMDQAAAAVHHARAERPGDSMLFSAAMSPDVRRHTDPALELHQAILQGHIRPAYQPLIELQGGQVVGFEALARWDHPERGPVSPAAFIPLAEDSGLIVDLGELILEQASRQTQAWRQAFPELDLQVGVNISPRQLATHRVLDVVRRVLAETGLPPHALVLEITESGLHQDLAGVSHTLQQLRDLDVRTAMDDFGIGYSSLSYLSRLPIDVLKIDKSFLDDREGCGPRLLNAVIGIGRELGMDTVAEGIEDTEQLEAVRAAGCKIGQGFLISRPVGADEATVLLRDWTSSGSALSES